MNTCLSSHRSTAYCSPACLFSHLFSVSRGAVLARHLGRAIVYHLRDISSGRCRLLSCPHEPEEPPLPVPHRDSPQGDTNTNCHREPVSRRNHLLLVEYALDSVRKPQ